MRNMEFYKHDQLFFYNVIKLAGETAKNVLLCHLISTAYRNKILQIMISGSKGE